MYSNTASTNSSRRSSGNSSNRTSSVGSVPCVPIALPIFPLAPFSYIVVGGAQPQPQPQQQLLRPELSTSATTATAGAGGSAPTTTTTTYVSVIDPHNRTGKIHVPLRYVADTRGRADALRTRNHKDLSLCLLHHRGRCNVGTKCHQMHVDPEYIESLRTQAAATPTCCAFHGDLLSRDLQGSTTTVEVLSTKHECPVRVPLSSFASTKGLQSFLRSHRTQQGNDAARSFVTQSRICRLHQDNRCKYGRDCRHMHLCRDAHKELMVNDAPATQPSGTVSKAPPATTTTTARNTAPVSRTAPLPLSPDIIDVASSHCSAESVSATPTTTTVTPLNATAVATSPPSFLDDYIRGWHTMMPPPTSSGSLTNVTQLQANDTPTSPTTDAEGRSPSDLHMLCSQLLGESSGNFNA
eukprot:PhM_4_TR18054/c1_g1_i1/m.41059